ncbi:MAG TPA: DUF3787 domain-containing protein [Pseudobacteroides sp.]|uniref:DUF3787 domain-containing protein n=1 Tax=Pseudobacteroides sp. TaxID=1968840 RepID=UPI002F94B33A
MDKELIKRANLRQPIEKHDTAAWANIEAVKSDSCVTIPSDIQVRNSKEHVDTNEK